MSKLSRPQLKKLNIGCGMNKIPGYVNIDIEKSCKPDLVHNFVNEKLPFKNNSVSEILLFHTIEHVQKRFHARVLAECWRVLVPKGRIIITYPEFLKCVKNWRTNYRGMRDFWENTIFGRQLYPGDAHVCIMHTPYFIEVMIACGFDKIVDKPEPHEKQYTTITAIKGDCVINYEQLVGDYVKNIKVVKDR